MYCFSQPIPSKVSFNHLVLELVKLVQSALALLGFFDLSPEERDGLLCNVTAEGITRWTDAVGDPLLSLEVRLLFYDLALLNMRCSPWNASATQALSLPSLASSSQCATDYTPSVSHKSQRTPSKTSRASCKSSPTFNPGPGKSQQGLVPLTWESDSQQCIRTDEVERIRL